MLWLKHHFSDLSLRYFWIFNISQYFENIQFKINYSYIFLYIKEESSNLQKTVQR